MGDTRVPLPWAVMESSVATIRANVGGEGPFTLTIEGRLDSKTTDKIWREALKKDLRETDLQTERS